MCTLLIAVLVAGGVEVSVETTGGETVTGKVALSDLKMKTGFGSAVVLADKVAQITFGEPDVVVTATLSKAVGAAGGLVAGPIALRRHLLDTGRTFVYDTALPPSVAAGALAGLGLARAADDERALLRARSRQAFGVLRDAGLDAREPAAGVLSVATASAESAVAWTTACRGRGAGSRQRCARPRADRR